MASVLDRIRNRGRIEDSEEAEREALIEDEARARIATAERERRVHERTQELSPQQEAPQQEQATGRGGSSINPVNIKIGGINIGGQGDDGTFWVIVSLLIFFLLDTQEWLGGTYSGFTFAWWGVSFNWALLIITSPVFVAFLFFNIIIRFFNQKFDFALLLILFFVINYGGRIFGQSFNFGTFNLYFVIIGLVIVFVLFYVFKFNMNKEGFVSFDDIAFLIFTFVYSFFLLNTGWIYQWKAILHFGFITLFGVLFIREKEEGKPSWYLWTIGILMADFFGYNFFKNLLVGFKYVSFLTFAVAFYVRSKVPNDFANWTAVIIFAVFLIFSLGTVSAYLGYDWLPAEKSPALKERSQALVKTLGQYIERQLEYATGGLYLSSVEKNQFEPLGVYFDRVRQAQPRYYKDEEATIWATIKSRTLSDPVIVRFNCFRYSKNNERIPLLLNDGTAKDGKIIPDKPFEVFTLEDKDVECTFNKDTFNVGTQTLTLSAEYNFETSAYQKVYFIDKARQRAMIREELDPLKEFGIADRNPRTVFTNGPVEIGVDVQHPIPISADPIADDPISPAIGIRLANRDKITDKDGKPVGEWQGKILWINELWIIVPNKIKIDGENCKPVAFTEIGVNDCIKSCDKIVDVTNDRVYEFCIQECQSGTDCEKQCKEQLIKPQAKKSKEECVEDCNVLFKGETGAEDYVGYALDTKKLYSKENPSIRNRYKDIDKNRDFLCRIKPTQEILEKAPITTKFIRVKAKYDYLLDKSYSIVVLQPFALASEKETITDEEGNKYARQAPSLLPTNFPSKIDLDNYFKSKNSELYGYGQCFKDVEQQTGVPAIVILSIGRLESGDFGKLSALARVNYALFGITCSQDYVNRCPFTDKEKCCVKYKDKNGKEWSYRAYPNYCNSIIDFGNLISKTDRYSGTLKYKDTPEEMIRKIGQAGYNPNPDWPGKVIDVMNSIRDDLRKLNVVLEPDTGTQVAQTEEQSPIG
ncbi:glucosaminidase domain-containing protein [Candidatus Woesearchaeota archaeon]|nr:glucosaminidase domain-containing protein [Candidatus Woesearchaeota archaeon]